MFEEFIVAGSGGQGVLLAGEVIAMTFIDMGGNATWLPSYGPEMRGGTANCSVVISSEEIGSPMVDEPTVFICFNQPSMLKFGPKVKNGGMIIANDDAIEEYCELNENVNMVKINAQKIAMELGNPHTVNMVMLGALIKKTKSFDIEGISKVLTQIWGSEKSKKLLPINVKAIQAGMDAVS